MAIPKTLTKEDIEASCKVFHPTVSGKSAITGPPTVMHHCRRKARCVFSSARMRKPWASEALVSAFSPSTVCGPLQHLPSATRLNGSGMRGFCQRSRVAKPPRFLFGKASFNVDYCSEAN